MSFETPLNVVLTLSILHSLYRLAWPSTHLPSPLPTEHSHGYNWLPPKHPETTIWKLYTPRSLAAFDGKDGGRILLAIDRNVFDVSTGKGFYGPGEHIICPESGS